MYTMQNFLQPTPDFDLEEVVGYAKRKGVDWIAHTETGGNVTNFENQIEAAFSLLRAARASPASRPVTPAGRRSAASSTPTTTRRWSTTTAT